jgi:hypothetical protein
LKFSVRTNIGRFSPLKVLARTPLTVLEDLPIPLEFKLSSCFCLSSYLKKTVFL